MGDAVRAEDFVRHLAGGKVDAAILLLGGDVYWRNLCREKLVDVVVTPETRGWAITRISLKHESLEDALVQAQTLPMLGGRQLVFVEDVGSVEYRTEESRDAALNRLNTYLDGPSLFSVLVLEAVNLDQRGRLYKLISQKATIVTLAAPDDRAVEIVCSMAERLGVRIDQDAATILTDLSGRELARLQLELEKLAAYVGEAKRITAVDVRSLVPSAQVGSVWDLAEALTRGPRARALQILDSLLRVGESGPKLVGALAWTYRKLLEAQDLSPGTTRWQAAGQLGMRPEMAESVLRRAGRVSRDRLRSGLLALAEADNQLKSSGVDARTILEFLIVDLTRNVAKDAADGSKMLEGRRANTRR